jgi:hypothetical protein
MKAKLLIFRFSIAIFATGAPFTPRAEAYQDYALSSDGGDRVTITAQPTNQAVAVGAGATFSVTAAGRPGSSHDKSPRDIECVTSEPCAQVSLTAPLELSKLYNLINWVTPAMFL